MKFVELKKCLKDKIDNAYLLKGNDDFILNYAYNLIFDACNISMPELNENVYNSELIDMEEVVKSLNTLPVFCDKKIIYVNLENRSGNDVKKLNLLNDYFTSVNPSSVFVIRVGNVSGKDFFSPYANNFTLVDCNKIDATIVKSFFEKELSKYKKSVTNDAFNLVFSYCNGEMSKLLNELTKLVSFVGDREVIERQDIEEICTKTMEFQIFELTENLAKKNANKVYEIISTLKVRKDEFRGLLGLIYGHFRRLLYVSITKASRDEFAEMLNVQPFAITKAMEQSKYFTKKQLKEIVDICTQLDYDTKLSKISVENAVEYLILKILNY